MSYWVAKDKDGTIHFSNVRPCKPSEIHPNNPNANDDCFWIPNCKHGIFFIEWYEDIPELTFENSPKEIKLQLV